MEKQYKEISRSEWDSRGYKSYDMNAGEISHLDQIPDISIREVGGYMAGTRPVRIPVNHRTRHSDTEVRFIRIDMDKFWGPRMLSSFYPVIHINKSDDEWFYLKLFRRDSVGDRYFLCDQISGVCEFINDSKYLFAE